MVQKLLLVIMILLPLVIGAFVGVPVLLAPAMLAPGDLTPVVAQTGPERVEIVAADGLVLVGDFYAPEAAPTEGDAAAARGAPAVLLLHMASSSRQSWGALIPPLTGAGYAVLAVDMRGHGETGGAVDWPLVEDDTRLWCDWLRAQPALDPARINLLGASVGANLALRGMANDAEIVTAIALSPALEYVGLTTDDAVQTIDKRPVFLATAQSDAPSNKGVKALAGQVGGQSLVRFYTGSAHGVSLLSKPDLIPLIIGWLDQFNGMGT